MTDQPIVAAPPVTSGAIVSLANLPKNMTLGQLVNAGSGKKFDRIWRIVPGQPVDAKNRAASSNFYVTRTVNDKADPTKKVVENSLGIAKKVNPNDVAIINVIPLGYNLDRELGTYNQDDNTYTQRCHSNDFRNPDARYKGKVIAGEGGLIAGKCAEIRLKTYKATGEPILDDNGNMQYELVKLCPLANFKAPKVEGGKPIRPSCSEVYTIYVAVKAPFTDPADSTKTIEKWVCAEINMRVMQAKLGAAIVARLGQLEAQGKPLSTYPLRLTLTEYKQSGTMKSSYEGELLKEETPLGVIPPEEFEALSALATDTKSQRKKWSEYDPDAKETDEPTTASVVGLDRKGDVGIHTISLTPDQPATATTTATPPQGKEIIVTATSSTPVEQPKQAVPDLMF